MGRMEIDVGVRRDLLRQRLQRLIAQDMPAATTIDAQIEELLQDILEDDLAPLPAPAWIDEPDEDQRIVVTGMGLLTPLGIGIDSFWAGLTEGRSGVGPITLCDPGESPSRIAAEVGEFDPRNYLEAMEARRISRASQFAVAAARMALADSGLVVDASNRHNVGALIANGSSSPPDTELAARTLI